MKRFSVIDHLLNLKLHIDTFVSIDISYEIDCCLISVVVLHEKKSRLSIHGFSQLSAVPVAFY